MSLTDKEDVVRPETVKLDGVEGTITIRSLLRFEEYVDCEQLQRETWGKDFNDVVPASLIKVSHRIGGVAVGAFDANGELIGFVFGMTGFEDGRPVHWSHMLAVKKNIRGVGIGKELKLFQRALLLNKDITEVFWTFDPLVSRNAYLNLTRLGAEVSEYVVDMYGQGESSELHRGLGTDRFILVWRIRGDRVIQAIELNGTDAGESEKSPYVVNPRSIESDDCSPPRDGELPLLPEVRIEVPPEIHTVRSVSAETAHLWRVSTRRALQWYLKHNFEVSTFYRDPSSGRCFYCLVHRDP